MIMELSEAIAKRYSCRSLEPVEISTEHLEQILEAGRVAPSGWNKQPFDFLVVTERERIEKVAQSQEFIHGASVLIGIVADPDASGYWREDIAAAAENMLLTITSLGYGSTWVEGTILPQEEELKDYFNIPQQYRFIIVLPIGKENPPGKRAAKRSLQDMIHRETW
jgi:nitroreductase